MHPNGRPQSVHNKLLGHIGGVFSQLKDTRVVHGELARNALHKETASAEGNQLEAAAQNLQLVNCSQDVITEKLKTK